ncbi:MAG: hypothetical protein WC025_00700 [Candidatus Magasanikbacteria bacterium]
MSETKRNNIEMFIPAIEKENLLESYDNFSEKVKQLLVKSEKVTKFCSAVLDLLHSTPDDLNEKLKNKTELVEDLKKITFELNTIFLVLAGKEEKKINFSVVVDRLNYFENKVDSIMGVVQNPDQEYISFVEDENKNYVHDDFDNDNWMGGKQEQKPTIQEENDVNDNVSKQVEQENEEETEIEEKSDFVEIIKNENDNEQEEPEKDIHKETPKKLGFFKKLFSKEGRQEIKKDVKSFGKGLLKALPNMAYKTATSVFGVKLVTDSVGLIVDKVTKGKNGWGDYAKMSKNKYERKEIEQTFREAFEEILVKNTKETKSETETTEAKRPKEILEKIAKLDAKIDSSQASNEDKVKLKEKLHEILEQDNFSKKEVYEGVKEKIAEIIKTYTDNKLSLITVLKDALNTAGVATGLFALRGVAYAGTSMAERIRSNRSENKKKELEGKENEKESTMKDLFLNSTIETLRGLGFQGIKKDRTTLQKGVDFAKSVGTILRGLGIYGVAFGDTDIAGAFHRLSSNLEEHGLASTVGRNFVDNIERVFHISHGDEFRKTLAEQQKEVGMFAQNMGLTAATSVHEQLHVGQNIPIVEPRNNIAENIEVNHEPQIFSLTVTKGGSAWGTLDKTLDSDNTPQEFKNMFVGDKHVDFSQWREKQLLDMGYQKVNGHWGSPFTIHAGAEMKVYKGEDGDWHARFDKELKAVHADTHREYRTINVHKTLHFQNENKHDIADTNKNEIANTLKKIANTKDVNFDEKTGEISLVEHHNTSPNLEVHTDHSHILSTDNTDHHVKIESGTNFETSIIPAKPSFFDESQVIHNQTHNVDHANNIEHNTLSNGQAKKVETTNITSELKSMQSGVKDTKSGLIDNVSTHKVGEITAKKFNTKIENIGYGFDDSPASEYDERGISKVMYDVVKERIISSPDTLSEEAKNLIDDNLMDPVEKTRELSAMFVNEGTLTDLSLEEKLFLGGDDVFNNSHEFTSVAVYDGDGKLTSTAYLPIGHGGSTANHCVGLKMAGSGEYRFVSSEDSIFVKGMDKNGDAILNEIKKSNIESNVL